MKRSGLYAAMLMGGMTMSVLAGEASTSATASNAGGGNAGATARYDGSAGSVGITRTNTRTGDVNLSRGLAVGVDKDGLDLSFSHAIAPKNGPAYAGTFNLSVGANGQVNGSYGGVVSEGGAVRSVEAGGSTNSSSVRPATSTAIARGDATPGGRVTASTRSYSTPQPRIVRPVPVRRISTRSYR